MRRGAYQPAHERQRAERPQTGAFAAFLAAAALLVASAGWAQPGPGNAEAFPTLPIHVTVAENDGEQVVPEVWLEAQVAMANRIFEDAGLSFVLVGSRAMPTAHARLEDRRDRHALGDMMQPQVINWFAVQSLRDVDDPSRMRMGVHWRPAGHPGAHVVIVASHAAPDVLAHELGHFFGNREHPDTPGNIMSYRDTPPGTLPFFDAVQKRRIRRFARRFLQTREITTPSELLD